MTIIPVTTVDEVLEHALTAPLVPIEWTEADQSAADVAADAEAGIKGTVVTH